MYGLLVFLFSIAIQSFLKNSAYNFFWETVRDVNKPEYQKRLNYQKFNTQIDEYVVHVLSIIWQMHISFFTSFDVLNFTTKNYFGRIISLQPVPETIYNFYIFHIISWTYQLWCVLRKKKESRDKYHILLVVHHCLTLVLLHLSSNYNLYEFGVFILFIHDASDIFLDFSKMCNYLYTISLGKFSLIMLNLVWVYTRVFLFGKLMLAIKDEFIEYGVENIAEIMNITENARTIGYGFLGLLSILYFFNSIWYLVMSRITLKVLFQKKWEVSQKIIQDAYE